MKARIEELKEFYENNITEPKIHFFEKYRLRLKRALHKKIQLQPEGLKEKNFTYDSHLLVRSSEHAGESPKWTLKRLRRNRFIRLERIQDPRMATHECTRRVRAQL